MKKNMNYDLWEATRTNGIESKKSYNTKEIAADIRKHLRERFPMCKWSVTSGSSRVDVKIKTSPFTRESDELEAIVAYACKYTNSWNYDNSDIMTDYFDVCFYSNITYAVSYNGDVNVDCALSYDYSVREMTEEEKAIVEMFGQKKAAWEEAERIREEKEFEEHIKNQEAERVEREKGAAVRQGNHDRVEAMAEVREVSYSVANLVEPDSRKQDSVGDYLLNMDCELMEIEFAKVSREVHLDDESYELFSGMLMDDWNFLAGMGGSETDDPRVHSFEEYNRMNPDDRDAVKWYATRCVAIYNGDNLKMVIDPQGYDYARYVFFPTVDTVVLDPVGEMVS